MDNIKSGNQASFPGNIQLALDFANTVDWHASSHPEEGLTSYPRLVGWAKDAGILTSGEAKDLLARAEDRPKEAWDVLSEAVLLREAIYHILSGYAHKLPARADDLQVLNRAIAGMLARSRLEVSKNGDFLWGWNDGRDRLDTMLPPVIRSAADLLISGDKMRRVGQCADERGCGWLFIDTSKNRSRRWCDMKDCGNRAKARRHYRKQVNEKKG